MKLNNLLEALEEIYLKREIIPKMWDHTANFYKENIWPDLIDIGEKIHHTKKTHSRARAVAMIFFPRTIREFKTFEDGMEEIVDKFEAENPPQVPEDQWTEEVKEEVDNALKSKQEIVDAPVIIPQENIAKNLFGIKEKTYPYKRVTKNADNINGTST